MAIKDKAKTDRTMGLLAIGILVVGFVLVSLVLWMGNTLPWMKYVGYAVMADFFIALILSSVLEMFKKKGKILRAIDHVAIWNLQIYWIVIQLIFPSMLIITGVIFIILLPFSAVNLFLKGLAKEIALCEQSILFISLSIGAIISAHYTKYLFPLITRLLTANGHRYEKYFTILVEYVYNPANLQFVVYFLYVVYLSVSTIYRFQTGGQPIWGNDTDIAVLESFLVFVAFSNMKAKHEATKLKFSDLFRIMFAMWTTRDDIGERYE